MRLVPPDVSLAAGCAAGISSMSNVLWRFPGIYKMSGTARNRAVLRQAPPAAKKMGNLQIDPDWRILPPKIRQGPATVRNACKFHVRQYTKFWFAGIVAEPMVSGRQHLLVHRLSTDVLDILLTGFTRDFKPQRTQKSQRLQNYAAFVVFVAD